MLLSIGEKNSYKAVTCMRVLGEGWACPDSQNPKLNPQGQGKGEKKKTGREDELYGVAQQKHKKGQLSCFCSGKLKSNRPA